MQSNVNNINALLVRECVYTKAGCTHITFNDDFELVAHKLPVFLRHALQEARRPPAGLNGLGIHTQYTYIHPHMHTHAHTRTQTRTLPSTMILNLSRTNCLSSSDMRCRKRGGRQPVLMGSVYTTPFAISGKLSRGLKDLTYTHSVSNTNKRYYIIPRDIVCQ